ncbi:hypothetical protein [Nocardia sp. A7]|uniref:hypothetical protein n=1 Tax=Nocardia sp. A7 TaxID=2789274 RepID=UPI00397E43A2
MGSPGCVLEPVVRQRSSHRGVFARLVDPDDDAVASGSSKAEPLFAATGAAEAMAGALPIANEIPATATIFAAKLFTSSAR